MTRHIAYVNLTPTLTLKFYELHLVSVTAGFLETDCWRLHDSFVILYCSHNGAVILLYITSDKLLCSNQFTSL